MTVPVTGAVTVPVSGAAVATPPDPAYCSLTGMTVYEWDGGGDGSSWSDAANWSSDTVPGTGDLDDAYVCLPDGAAVEMADGVVATVQAIDTSVFASLTIDAGAGLFVYGDPATRPSTIRGGLSVLGAIGGPGRIDLTSGLMDTGVFDSSVVLDVPPAMASNPCEVFDGLPLAACTSVEGTFVNYRAINAYGGMELLGGYDLILHGALVPGNAGIAMSPGSRLVVQPLDADHPAQVNIHGNADFYPTATGTPRPVVINEGIIRKWRGGGPRQAVTVISTAYTGAGQVWVEDEDVLVIADGSTRSAEVTAGSVLGSGPCRRVAGDCTFTTLGQRGKRQSATFQAPASQPEVQRALVRVRPRPDLRRQGDLGWPYLVHADELAATAVTPALIELRYDGRLLRGRTWADVQVFRQRAAGAPWRRVRACQADGTPPGSRRACVDRRGLAESSRAVPNSGGDAILVVRTTVTSRWRVGT